MTKKKLSTKFKIGKYTCQITIDPETKKPTVSWEPHKPSFSSRELRDFQDERDAFLLQVSEVET